MRFANCNAQSLGHKPRDIVRAYGTRVVRDAGVSDILRNRTDGTNRSVFGVATFLPAGVSGAEYLHSEDMQMDTRSPGWIYVMRSQTRGSRQNTDPDGAGRGVGRSRVTQPSE